MKISIRTMPLNIIVTTIQRGSLLVGDNRVAGLSFGSAACPVCPPTWQHVRHELRGRLGAAVHALQLGIPHDGELIKILSNGVIPAVGRDTCRIETTLKTSAKV